jgi:hypothetical protein
VRKASKGKSITGHEKLLSEVHRVVQQVADEVCESLGVSFRLNVGVMESGETSFDFHVRPVVAQAPGAKLSTAVQLNESMVLLVCLEVEQRVEQQYPGLRVRLVLEQVKTKSKRKKVG